MDDGPKKRLRILISGAVQGVGFRPFIYRLANEMSLPGWVINNPQGVIIEAEGSSSELNQFLEKIENNHPQLSVIDSIDIDLLPLVGYQNFEVRPSEPDGERRALVLPDIGTCPDCLADIADPSNRRFRYPFTNCTNCGPRFSIIESLPYDRCNTTMKIFSMCPECMAEYSDPSNRRFHAQPNACPRCGPRLRLLDTEGKTICEKEDALQGVEKYIRDGHIAAIKGLGGFHLVVDARNADTVRLLRLRKHREEKPLALMYPSIDAVLCDCYVSPEERALLESPASPIVLLRRRETHRNEIAGNIAPCNPHLGVMLPYTPLHHLLLADLGFPVVATSGNLSDEPICIDERDALSRLNGIADIFLSHNRPITRHVDDSVARIIKGKPQLFRRSRGYAPFPVKLDQPSRVILAVGSHLKNTVALSVGRDVFISQHIGDLETSEAYEAFLRSTDDLPVLYEHEPEVISCDMHPDYLSTQFAVSSGLPLVKVQHHYAHVLSCMAEHKLASPVLGVTLDGAGYGLDSSIWGGEFLLVDDESFTRVATLRQFPLPGSDKAAKEPRRAALGLLYTILGEKVFEYKELETMRAFSGPELSVIKSMLRRGFNSPMTSSIGRLFDGVASLLGLHQKTAFEGQAAMSLEFLASESKSTDCYGFQIDKKENIYIIDWAPLILGIIDDYTDNIGLSEISAKFHNTLVKMIVETVSLIEIKDIALTGGCFQNRYLTEKAIDALEAAGNRVYIQRNVPPNDGGIALGQVLAATRELAKE